jgi:LysR family transcriptional regulator, nitrogen assimilation regulatory protein
MANLSILDLFVQAAALGSLTKAAVKLDVTQSAASRRISALEAEFGGRVFHRTGRGVKLTELGERVLPRARALVGEADRLISEARNLAGKPSGTVIVGVLPSVSRPLISRLYDEVCRRFPDVHLQINETYGGQLDEAVANGLVDIAVLNRYGRSPPKGEELLARAEVCLVGRVDDRITRSATVPFAALKGLPLLLPSAPNAWRSELDGLARRHGFSLVDAMTVDSASLLLDLVSSSGCYGVLPAYYVRHEAAQGRVRASRIVKPQITRMLTLAVTSQRPATLAVREVSRLIRAIVPSIVGAGTKAARQQ